MGPKLKRLFALFLCGFLVLAFAVVFLCWGARSGREQPLARLTLGDGRILQVEGTTYGTHHSIGNPRSELLRRFQPWLPKSLATVLLPQYPQSQIQGLDHPSLVIWVNAINAISGTNVDCQGIRVELVDEHGDIFEPDNSSWFSSKKGNRGFWREGYIFPAFPRTQKKFTMQVTTWKQNQTNRAEIPNAFVSVPAVWTGQPLPQTQKVDGLEIVLNDLKKLTNGGAKPKYWETSAVYWQPVWELRRNGQPIEGWDAPEWMAEDPSGNKAKHLGVHQPVLRYSARFYPSGTNLEMGQLLAALPNAIISTNSSIQWWNQKIQFGTNEILALGFFPGFSNYVFSGGVLFTNAPTNVIRRVRGGAPTGWTSSSRVVSPLNMQRFYNHYTDKRPVIYLHVPDFETHDRLAMRLRDRLGRYWLAKPEPLGTREGIYPFLVDVPSDVTNIVPELVLLKPVEAEFTVKVPDSER